MSYRTPSLPSGRSLPLVPWWQALEAWRAEGMDGLDVEATRRRLGGRGCMAEVVREVARLRSLLDVTARELVAARAAAEGWREEATGLRAIVEGRDVAPTAQEIDAHDGAWVVRYLRPRDPKRGERVAFCGAGWRQNARDMAAQHETTWWLPLDREGRPTAWPVPA